MCVYLNCMNWLSDPSSIAAAWCAVGRKRFGAGTADGGGGTGGGGDTVVTGGDIAPNGGGNSLAVAVAMMAPF